MAKKYELDENELQNVTGGGPGDFEGGPSNPGRITYCAFVKYSSLKNDETVYPPFGSEFLECAQYDAEFYKNQKLSAGINVYSWGVREYIDDKFNKTVEEFFM